MSHSKANTGFSLESIELDVRLRTSYLFQPSEGTQKGLLVLHGFTDRAQSVRKRLLGEDPIHQYHVLVPNGLFPCPVRKEKDFKEAYAWYFRDPSSGSQMIAPEFAADSLIKLIRELNLSKLVWTILGFSQGGFFAPYLVKAGLPCHTIISVGAAYRVEAYEGLSSLAVYALHGEKDQVVPFQYAKDSFKALEKAGFGQRFFSLPLLGHTLDHAGRKIIRDLLQDRLGMV